MMWFCANDVNRSDIRYSVRLNAWHRESRSSHPAGAPCPVGARLVPTPPLPDLDDALRAAVAGSTLRDLAEPMLTAVLDDATRLRLPAGAVLRAAGERGAHLELVVTGLLRIYGSCATCGPRGW
jgi:hypothetical protein